MVSFDDRSIKRLAVAVLANAVQEAVTPVVRRGKMKEEAFEKKKLERLRAIKWITSNSEGMQMWSYLSDIDPDAIASRMRSKLPKDVVDQADALD